MSPPNVVFHGNQDSYNFTDVVSGKLHFKTSMMSSAIQKVDICLKSYEIRQNVTYGTGTDMNGHSYMYDIIKNKDDVVYTSPTVTISSPGKIVDYSIQLDPSVPNSFKSGDYIVRTCIEVTLSMKGGKTHSFTDSICIVSEKKIGHLDLYTSAKIPLYRKPSIFNAFNAFSSGEVECMLTMNKKEYNPEDIIDVGVVCSSKSGTPLKNMRIEFVQRTYFNSFFDSKTFGQITHKAKNVSTKKHIPSKVRGDSEMKSKLESKDCFKYKMCIPSTVVDVRPENKLKHHIASTACVRIRPKCWMFGEYEAAILCLEGVSEEVPREDIREDIRSKTPKFCKHTAIDTDTDTPPPWLVRVSRGEVEELFPGVPYSDKEVKAAAAWMKKHG